MNARRLCSVAAVVGATWSVVSSVAADPGAKAATLQPVASFSKIGDERTRSMALFAEAGKVLQSPRCLNCHPVTRQPTQGDDLHPHEPFMQAGPGDHGVPGLPCRSCHGAANATTLASSISTIPGHPLWGLAPASMAWQGKSLRDICLQIKDGARNGGRSLPAIHEHLAKDPLVGWAWHPGEGRVPAPGSQAEFGELIQAWISTGAHCPAS